MLVCDDDDDIRMVVGLNLDLAGMSYGEAGSGEEALQCLRTGDWDALVLDLMMPEMDGLAVLKTMKAESLTGNTAVVVLSGEGSPVMAIEALKIGAHSYLTKPFSPIAVAQALGELIDMPPGEREDRRREAIERAGTLERLGLPSV